MPDDWKSVAMLVAAVAFGGWAATMEARLRAAQGGADVEAVAASLAENHVEEIAATALPVGIVIASTVRCSELRGGWRAYYPAAGRFVVGAGPHAPNGHGGGNLDQNGQPLTVYDPPGKLSDETLQSPSASNRNENRRTGGAEMHKLEKDEIPKHHHKLPFHIAGDNRVGGGNHFLDRRNTYRHDFPIIEDQIFTEDYGGGGHHNNMPPYIALNFCQRIG